MLRRWQAIIASTSNGRKRKSAIILVTSKSKKFGRVCVSAMIGGSGSGLKGIVRCTTNLHIGPFFSNVKSFCSAAKLGGGKLLVIPRLMRRDQTPLDSAQARV